MKSFAAAAAAALCDAILLLLLYQLLLFVILCRIAKFLAGSLNLIPSIVFFLFILQCRIYGLTLPNILGNYRHARSKGWRQPVVAKPPLYDTYIYIYIRAEEGADLEESGCCLPAQEAAKKQRSQRARTHPSWACADIHPRPERRRPQGIWFMSLQFRRQQQRSPWA